jgi:hypothetical protein
MATKAVKKSTVKPIIDRKKLTTAYCYVCEDFVKTQLVDIKVATVEISPSKIIKTNDQQYDFKESTHTVTKCLSCESYDSVMNRIEFSDAVYKLVTNEVLKVLKKKKVI